MAAEELDSVNEAGMEGGSPPHSGRPHASLGRKPRYQSRSLEAAIGGEASGGYGRRR